MSASKAAPWTIRHGRLEDLPGILEIYNHYVLNSAATFDLEPFGLEARIPWMEQFGQEGRFQMFVAVHAGQVLGYAYSGSFRERKAYDTSVEATVYLAPDAVGLGLGRALYDALLPRLQAFGLHRVIAGITLPNPGSIALHEACGFEHVGTMSEVGSKMGRYWDVGWWEKRLDGGKSNAGA